MRFLALLPETWVTRGASPTSLDVTEKMGAPKALLMVALERATWIAVTTTLLLIAVALLRRRSEQRSLTGRVTYELLPTDSFEPSAQAVLRLAAQLSRVRPAVSLAPRRSCSLRVTVATGSDGLVHHRISGPAKAASVLRLASYSQVELRRLEAGQDIDPVPTMQDWLGRSEDGTSEDTPTSRSLLHRLATRIQPRRDTGSPDDAAPDQPELEDLDPQLAEQLGVAAPWSTPDRDAYITDSDDPEQAATDWDDSDDEEGPA